MTHHYLVYIVASLLTYGLPAKTPNLIIILTDDQGYNDVGFNGCIDIPTPHLDQLAANGVKFTDGYVSYPVCGPSRAGLLTGRYQDRFGFTTNPTIDPNNPDAGLPKSEENIAKYSTRQITLAPSLGNGTWEAIQAITRSTVVLNISSDSYLVDIVTFLETIS